MDEILYTGVKFRLYPTVEQEILFKKTAGCCRQMYNLRVAGRKLNNELFNAGMETIPLRTEAEIKKEFSYMVDISSQALQGATKDADQAFTNCFKHKKNYPKFKKKGTRDAFRLPQLVEVDVNQRLLRLGKLKWCTARGSFDQLVGKIKSITVKRDAGNWYATVLQEVTPAQYYRPQKCGQGVVGIDVGITKPLTLSYGDDRHFVVGTRIKEKLVRLEQRRLRYRKAFSRKQIDSNNRNKAKLRLSKAFQRERFARQDFVEQTSHRLARHFDTVVFEDLKLTNMTRSAKGTIENPGKNVKAKSGLNRELLRMGFGALVRRTQQKCERYGSQVVKVNPRNTSRTCYDCGTIDKLSRKSQARFHCVHCGFKINADVNAAHNIRRLGTRLH